MKELRYWKPGDAMRILPWGKIKVGKTYGAGTWPRPCFLDFDRGIATLASPDFTRVHGLRNIIYEQFGEKDFDSRAIVKTHNAYDDACRFFDEMMAPANRTKFDSWVIDSGTTLFRSAENKGVILMGTKEYGERSKSHQLALKRGMLIPVIQDYGAERSLGEQFVDMVLSTDKHVLLLCHEREQRDKAGDLLAITPMLTGQSAEVVPLKFDEVYNIQAQKGETHYNKETHVVTQDWIRLIQTTPDGLRAVGSRNGVPDGTAWNYEAISKAFLAAHEERVKQQAALDAADKAAVLVASGTPTAAHSG
jgi:hypothetical protein